MCRWKSSVVSDAGRAVDVVVEDEENFSSQVATSGTREDLPSRFKRFLTEEHRRDPSSSRKQHMPMQNVRRFYRSKSETLLDSPDRMPP
jgi:hypothetical protein